MGNECYKSSRYYKTPITLISNYNMSFSSFISSYSHPVINYKRYRNIKMTMPDSPDIPYNISTRNSSNIWTISSPNPEIFIGSLYTSSKKYVLFPNDTSPKS
jgi:hypothetical protein